MTEDNFYRDFEERFYAPREIIRELRKVYLPFVKPLTKIYIGDKVFDIGCGRGEWLELMSEIEFEAYGCDIDDGMLKDCYERGLSASKKEGISFLKSLSDESHVIISAFHVIEHISFDDLRTLVSESLRILKPGGLLILETPNPENIIVGNNNFYLDPTHKRPIPSLLLSFLPEYYGFKRNKLLRLQESSELALAVDDRIKLIDIFRGVSPDIAVVAQKNASIEIMNLFNQAFDKNYGLTLDDLANRYDDWRQSMSDKLSKEIEAVRAESASKEQDLHSKIDELNKSSHHWWTTADQLTKELQSVYHSKSWRITWPLRKVMQSIRFIVKLPFKILKSFIKLLKGLLKKIIVPFIDFVLKRPSLKYKAKTYMDRFPRLKARFKSLAISSGILHEGRDNIRQIENPFRNVELNNLSPTAQKIYLELINNINFTKDNEILSIPYTINFQAKDNNSKNFIDSGFDYPESWGTWSCAKEATLFFDFKEHLLIIKPLYLKINFRAHAKNNHRQLFEFYLNNKLLANNTYDNDDDITLVLDIQNVAQKQNKLLIKIPDAMSPKALSINEDSRELGIGLINIQLLTDL